MITEIMVGLRCLPQFGTVCHSHVMAKVGLSGANENYQISINYILEPSLMVRAFFELPVHFHTI